MDVYGAGTHRIGAAGAQVGCRSIIRERAIRQDMVREVSQTEIINKNASSTTINSKVDTNIGVSVSRHLSDFRW